MEVSLGSYLRLIRKKLSFTLREVQAKIGVSNAYLSQIENDKSTNPSPNILHKLANFYNVSYEHLMTLAGYPSLRSEISKERSSKIEVETEDLSFEERADVLDYIKFVKSRRARK